MDEVPHLAIIDDDASIRDAVRNFVGSLGYSADTFCSAEAFMDSDRLASTNCIIVDMHMPGMSGMDLLRRLVADRTGIPVIMVTAFPQDATRDLALKNGAIGYLPKPLHEDSLIACLEHAVGPAN